MEQLYSVNKDMFEHKNLFKHLLDELVILGNILQIHFI